MAFIFKILVVWADDTNSALRLSIDLGKSEILALFQNIKLTSSFMVEASVDIDKLLARMMLWSVTGKRALWLKSWLADQAFKHDWCKILYKGHSLFVKC